MSTPQVRRSLPPAFEPVREIGHGGTSVVCEAVQRSTGRAVAVKVSTLPFDDTAASRRFAQECAMMAALAAHPNVVTLIDAGVHEDRPWIAMELCRRGSIAAMGALPADRVLDVLIAVAGAMDAAHRLGIVHCDLKPSNILVTDFGLPAIADFGIARHTSTSATALGGGYSLDHAAPEVLDGEEPTAATDVYCLGTTIWTLLSGRSPFRDSTATPSSAVAKRIMLDPLPPPPDRTPPELAALITDMTAKRPADRVASMAEVVDRARAVRNGRPPAEPAPAGRRPSRPRGALLARLAVLVAIVAIAVSGAVTALRLAPTTSLDASMRNLPPTSAAPTTTPAPNTLGLPTAEANLPCDGTFVVIIGSAVTPGSYAQEVTYLLSTAPGSHYLQTASSCGSFADRTKAGALIYAVYLGPYATAGEACTARARAPKGSVVLQLSTQPGTKRASC